MEYDYNINMDIKTKENDPLFFDQGSSFQEKLQHRRHIIKSLKANVDSKRSITEKLADWLTNNFGTIGFFLLNAGIFLIWVLINVGVWKGIEPFDPFPFGLLTMIVSLEAIFLSIFVLISQNREAKVADLREEIDLQINMIAEQEVTKVMKILTLLAKKQNINLSEDSELKEMLEPLDTQKIEAKLEQEIK